MAQAENDKEKKHLGYRGHCCALRAGEHETADRPDNTYSHLCTGSTKCTTTEYLTVTKLQFSSTPTPEKYKLLSST